MITTYAVSLRGVDCGREEHDRVIAAVDDWLVATFPEDAAGISRRCRFDVIYRLTVTIAAAGAPHIDTVTVTVMLDRGTLMFDLRAVATPTTTRVVPFRPAAVPPRWLYSLAAAVTACMPAEDANRRLDEVTTVAGADAAESLAAFLLHAPSRRLPVIVEVADPQRGTKPVHVMGTGPLAGNAHIFHLTDTAALSTFASSMGLKLLGPGTVMLFWPDREEPEVMRLREMPSVSVPREWDRLVSLVIAGAAGSIAPPRVPPPPRDDPEEILPDPAGEGDPPGPDGDAAVYIGQLENQVNELEAALADADRIIAEQHDRIERTTGQRDDLILEKVRLETIIGHDTASRTVPSMREALRIAEEKCTFLVFHPRAVESGLRLEGPEPTLVLQDLARLNDVARAWMAGEVSGQSLKVCCRSVGLDFAPSVSATARQKYEEDYLIDWHGETVRAEAHVRRGKKTHLYRIHVHFDEDRRQAVVAYIGRHLRDKGSSS